MPHRIAMIHAGGIAGMLTGGLGWTLGQVLNATSSAAVADPSSIANAASYGGVFLALISFLTLAVNRYFDDRKAARDAESARLDLEGRVAESERKIEEAHRAAKRVAEEAARRIEQTKAEALATAERRSAEDKEKRHKLRSDFQARLLELQADLIEERNRRARLEGHLGAVEQEHAAGINLNGAEIRKVADSLDPPIPVETPRIEPTSGSGDDLPAFPGPTP